VPTLEAVAPPCPDNGANPGGWETECNLGGFSGRGLRAQNEGDGGGLDEPTDLPGIQVYGMRPNYFPAGGSFYINDSLGNYENIDGNALYAEFFAYDFNRWQKHRSAACDAARLQSFLVAGSIASAAGTCLVAIAAAAPTAGFALAACGGALVVTGVAWAQMVESNKTCASGYPGAGNW
jgi:drug/metabolite transporter superfamily protein YnfA